MDECEPFVVFYYGSKMYLYYGLDRESLRRRKLDREELFEIYILKLIGFSMQYKHGDKVVCLSRRDVDTMYDLGLDRMELGFEHSCEVIMGWMRQALRIPSSELCTVESRMWGIEDCNFAWVQRRNYSLEDDLLVRQYDPELRWTYTASKHINLPNFEHFTKSKFYKNRDNEGGQTASAAHPPRTRAPPTAEQMADHISDKVTSRKLMFPLPLQGILLVIQP